MVFLRTLRSTTKLKGPLSRNQKAVESVLVDMDGADVFLSLSYYLKTGSVVESMSGYTTAEFSEKDPIEAWKRMTRKVDDTLSLTEKRFDNLPINVKHLAYPLARDREDLLWHTLKLECNEFDKSGHYRLRATIREIEY